MDIIEWNQTQIPMCKPRAFSAPSMTIDMATKSSLPVKLTAYGGMFSVRKTAPYDVETW
jgi:hypothetical protein